MAESSIRGANAIGITVCALILLILPLALWMAWSQTVFYVVLLVGLIAFLAIMLMIWRSPPDSRI